MATGQIVLGAIGADESISFDFVDLPNVNWMTIGTKALSITATHRATGKTQALSTWVWTVTSATVARATYIPDGTEWDNEDNRWEFSGYLTLDGTRRNLRGWTETVHPM